MKHNLAALRKEYLLASLDTADLSENPFTQFNHWFQQAIDSEIDDVNAMTLSTVDAEHKPHCRVVLLKGVEEEKFIFFTNYKSHKGQQINQNQHVAIVFYWKELQRQIRIEGIATKVTEEYAATYFASRPVESQLGAWASYQSEELASRAELEARFEALKEKYRDKEIPKPTHWGGYMIEPSMIEFWQGRMSRLHDRFCYTREGQNEWKLARLNP